MPVGTPMVHGVKKEILRVSPEKWILIVAKNSRACEGH